MLRELERSSVCVGLRLFCVNLCVLEQQGGCGVAMAPKKLKPLKSKTCKTETSTGLGVIKQIVL